MDFSNVDSPYDKETFGKCIRQQRKEQGLSLRKLAEKIDISPIYMSDIETGKKPVPIKNKNYELIDKIIKELKIPNEQRKFVIEMAKCTREYLKTISGYLPESQAGRQFIRIASEAELTDEEWKDLTNILLEKIKNKTKTNKL